MSGYIKIESPESISKDDISGLLCSAFEGGSSYWCCDLAVHRYPDGMGKSDFEFWHIEVPLIEGGVLKFRDVEEAEDAEVDEDGYYHLDLEKIKEGLAVLREKFPRHWSDFANKNDDATTGDCFLQCCIFGDIIYG